MLKSLFNFLYFKIKVMFGCLFRIFNKFFLLVEWFLFLGSFNFLYKILLSCLGELRLKFMLIRFKIWRFKICNLFLNFCFKRLK